MISEICGTTPEASTLRRKISPYRPRTDDAFLDARATPLVDAHHRAPRLHREVEHLDDLFAVHLAEAAAEDRDVLAEHADRAAVDGAVSGDDAVAERSAPLHAECGRAMAGELVELDERTLVEKGVDTLAGRLLALGVLLLDGPGGAGMNGFVVAAVQVGQLAGRGVPVEFVCVANEFCCHGQ